MADSTPVFEMLHEAAANQLILQCRLKAVEALIAQLAKEHGLVLNSASPKKWLADRNDQELKLAVNELKQQSPELAERVQRKIDQARGRGSRN